MSKTRDIANRFYQKQRNFILYALIGTLGTGLEILVFNLAYTLAGLHYQLANIMGFAVGCTVSFILNRAYNFKVRDNVALRLIRFFLIQILGLAVSSASLYCMIGLLSFDAIIAKIISVLLIALLLFILNKAITFRRREKR